MPFLALLLGGVVEGLSRPLAPLVGQIVPERVRRLVRGPRAVAPAPGAVAVASGADGSGAGAPSDTGAAAAAPTAAAAPVPLGGGSERTPMTKEAKRRLMLVLGLVGGALALVVAGIIGVAVVSSTMFAPEKEVEAYLDAVSAGDYGKAAELAPPNAPNGNRILLTDAVGAKTEKRVTSYTIDDVTKSGDSATVTATLDQDGKRTQQVFTVQRDGSRFLVLPEWKLGEVDYSEITFFVPNGIEKISVNGVEVDITKLETQPEVEGYLAASLPVQPGTYEFTAPALSEYVEAAPVSIPVGADGTMGDQGGDVSPDYTLNQKGVEKVQADVNAKIDECAATGDPSPEGCPLMTYSYNDIPGTWTVASYPVIAVQQDGEGSFYVSTETSGSATFTYSYDSFGTATQMTQEDTLTVNGQVELDDQGQPVLELTSY